MIHTGEKPLQSVFVTVLNSSCLRFVKVHVCLCSVDGRCEICGFTCRQKASLNWHMKKHDADATYQFSCSICGKKFEKKDCVVAHKAKSHPEVLIAEALAANAGALITTPASLLELPENPVQAEVAAAEVSHGQDGHVEQLGPDGQHVSHMVQQVNPQVVLLGQDQSLHTMQVPVTIALSPIDPPSPADSQHHLQLQMPIQFVQSTQQVQQLSLHPSPVVAQPQLQPLQPYPSHQQILQMTFQPLSHTHVHQIPILTSSQQLHTLQPAAPSPQQTQDPASTSTDCFILDNPVLSSSSPSGSSLQQTEGVVWEQTEQGVVLADSTERHMQQMM